MTRGQKPASRNQAEEQRLAPGMVRVRIGGTTGDANAVADVLARATGVEVLERSYPYENRNGPGKRVYMLLRITGRPG